MSKKEEGKAAKHVQAVAKTAKKAPVKKPSQRAAMPVKKPKDTPPSTVRGKIEAIQIERGAIEQGAAEIQHGIRAIEASINKQIDKYKDAIADFNNSILAQSKENKKAAASIYSGAREIQAGIEPKIKENAEYVKNFYG